MDELRVWAPSASSVDLVTDDGRTPMRADGGYWTAPALPPGTDYRFSVDGGEPHPDPASRRQPDGVHGPSRSYDQDSYVWHDEDWPGIDLHNAVVYELHVGTFTAAGTLEAAIERLPYLADLGVTHVELLPLNDFNGEWGWGYDGVAWFAVDESYGGPAAYRRFVDACHRRGLGVIQDVVYNHLGPSGNYLPTYGPYFKSGASTWGDLINLEEPAVRRFVIDNALMWLRDFHVDALRLDAVHALLDTSEVHLLQELSTEVDELSEQLGRPLILIAESDLNDAKLITPRERGGYGLHAQWDDDVHHALHSTLSGETQGYYVDFGPLDVLAKVLTNAFLHDGTYSTFRGRNHGAPVDPDVVQAWQFVVALQNHDQVGNRAAGDRLPVITSAGLLRVGAALLLTSPFTPMLFMGEEWAASTPFPFFSSHPEPDLATATAEGRIKEFAEHGWDRDQIVDPQAEHAFRDAVLNWAEADEPAHRSMLALYRELIALRRSEPDLHDPDLRHVSVDFDADAGWLTIRRGGFTVVANLAEREQTVAADGALVLTTGAADVEDGQVRLAGQSAAVLRT